MSFPAYPSYQNSGVEWLGEVPDHWLLTKMKHVYRFTTGWTPPTGRNESYEGENLWANISDLGAKVLTDTAKRISNDAIAASDMKLAPRGSLLFSFKLSIGQVSFAGRDMYTNEAIASFFPDQNADLSFAYYALPFFVPQNASENIYGAKMLNQELIRSALICIPPVSEQVAIAAFLDRETVKIDTLIEEQRCLITLLREKRQAVISHAVTKGLNPHAQMKASGIEWLGEVPAHWEVRALRRLVNPSRPITYGIVQPGEADPDGRFMIRGQDYSRGWVNPDDIFRVSNAVEAPYKRARLSAGDVVITIVGAGTGNTAVVPSFLEGANITQTTARVAPATEIVDGEYLATLLSSRHGAIQVALYQKGAAQPGLNLEHLDAFRFPLPPREEQNLIVESLSPVLTQITELITVAEQATALLKERRAALISAAVTGKMDVRGSAKVLPFPVDRARARGLVATEIIERSANQATFGRVKFQKIAFLAEAHVGISELAGSYTREAAGPLDRALIDEMERGARSIAGIEHEQPGGSGTTVSYRLGEQRGAHRQELADWLSADRTAKLDTLISDCASLTTKQAEAVATLYGVWNDALSEGVSPTDEQIIFGFLNDWHPEKRDKFRASDLPEWLGWMRRHGIVPTGSGPKTTTGRLFA